MTAIFTKSGKISGFLKITRDLTEKKQAEQALKQSEEKFRNLVAGVKDYAIFMLNPDGIVASWNEGARSIKGYEANEIIGKHFSIFYTEDKKLEKFPDYELEEAKRVGRFEDEGIRVKKDGSTFWANVVLTAIFNDENELIGFTKITRDLTERKQAEEIIRKSEERYKLMVDAVKDYSIFIVDPEGKIVSWNEGARRLKGYDENEVLGKNISIFYPSEKADANYPHFELSQARLNGRFVDEGLRVRKDGSTFYANVIITPLYDSNNTHLGFAKITRDLTERRAYEENLHKLNSDLENKVLERTSELEKTIKELKRINNDLDNFIYTASHDLKAPISNLEGLIYTLFEEIEEQVRDNGSLSNIKLLIDESISRFQKTIRELTEIAKIQKEISNNSEDIDVVDLIEDIKVSINEQISKNNAKIIVDVNHCSTIQFVRKNLKSIFYNLISNSIKYRSPDKSPQIRLTCNIANGNYVITCQDNGLGIRQENLSRMFTMFKRFHDHVEGTGVGLYIVKRIIENAGGKIEVESKEGEGTLFRIYLPI